MKPTFATPDEVSLQQLRALAAIAQTGSFTLAADALQLTQPAVSHLIKRMEQQLGQPLGGARAAHSAHRCGADDGRHRAARAAHD